MNYYKIKVSFNDYPSKLNRTLLINKDMNLFNLGWVIGESFKFEFSHQFMFILNNMQFCSKEMLDNSYDEEMYDYNKVNLSDLNFKKGLKFGFIYDFGEDYSFTVKILDDNVINDDNYFAKCLSGTGDTIFEDAKDSLLAFFYNEIQEIDGDNYFYPSNLDYDYDLSTYFNDLDLDDINMMIEENNSELINEDYDFGSFLKQ